MVLPAEAEAAALAALERGKAGASARAEGERRSKKREDGIRTKHPRIGGVVLALTDDPSTTKVWAKGAAGEERVGGRLEEARQQGIEVLHDRRIPGSKANIDHLAITPSGVWVVDAKRYTGKLERRDVGGRFETDPRLYVNGRDKSKLVEGVEWQMSKVRDAVIGGDFESVPIHGALCFVDTEFGFFAKPFVIGSVSVTWGRKLIAPMLEPVLLGPPAIARLTLLLAERLPVK